MERDNALGIEKFSGKIRGVLNTQYNCPTCKTLLPKVVYAKAKRPLYCLWCGQKLKYQMDHKEELMYSLLNDKQKKLLEKVDNILDNKEY